MEESVATLLHQSITFRLFNFVVGGIVRQFMKVNGDRADKTVQVLSVDLTLRRKRCTDWIPDHVCSFRGFESPRIKNFRQKLALILRALSFLFLIFFATML